MTVLTASPRRTPTAAAPLVTCRGLSRRFGDRTAVDDVSFTIAPGETYGLLGPNGAGKTTTIRLVCGLLRADAGDITIAGRPMTTGAVDTKRLIGYVPQDVALYPDLTARENLRFFARLYGMRGKSRESRIDEVLDLVELRDRGNERIESFSGGMRRRLNIAAGLVHRPQLLVLDEPTVGVDPQSRNAILTSVQAMGAAGMGVLYTTHYMEEAERLCDRVAILDRGRIAAEGTRRELVARVGERDRIELTGTGDLAGLATRARALEGVDRCDVADDGLHVLAVDGARLLPRVLALATECTVSVRSVDVVEPDLEAVFLHLTGTALRE